ncbi:MAG: hypothetical protein CMH83_23115 [Nocardioides sp.]|nr:hypothetical protein [Nocardioides sp.]
MSRKVFVHIGAPKTGTTYLQDRLGRNASTLADHGVHVPARNAITSPGLSQFRAALDLQGQDWGGPPGHAAGYWDAMARRIRRLDGTVILSHEILAPARPEHIAKLKADLAGSELHVVYSARDHGRQLPAAWQESIKQGRRWTYARFCKKVTRNQPWFARAFDLPTVLGNWSAGLSPDRVHVVTVPHERGGEVLWHRFCDVFGIDPAWAPLDSDRSNASLGAAETVLLRKLNKRMERGERRSARYDNLIRRMLAEGTLVQSSSDRITLPPAMQPWAQAEAERWIEWIEGSGVDVVGDVEDLRPRPLDPATPYANPDRVRARAQLKVALDALAAMTAEAARRPDPDDNLGRKVKQKLRMP